MALTLVYPNCPCCGGSSSSSSSSSASLNCCCDSVSGAIVCAPIFSTGSLECRQTSQYQPIITIEVLGYDSHVLSPDSPLGSCASWSNFLGLSIVYAQLSTSGEWDVEVHGTNLNPLCGYSYFGTGPYTGNGSIVVLTRNSPFGICPATITVVISW